MSNNSNRNQHVPMSERMNKEKKSLPDVIKYGTYICFIIPTLFLILYLTGAWEIKIVDGKMVPDTFDLMIRMGVVMMMIIGCVFVWITHYLYEKE